MLFFTLVVKHLIQFLLSNNLTHFQRGNTGWWKTLGGGTIDTKIGGAGGSPYAFIHENRVSPQSGIGESKNH